MKIWKIAHINIYSQEDQEIDNTISEQELIEIENLEEMEDVLTPVEPEIEYKSYREIRKEKFLSHQQDILKDFKDGMLPYELSDKYSAAKSSITSMLKLLLGRKRYLHKVYRNFSKRMKIVHAVSPEALQQTIKMFRDGKDLREIYETTGVTLERIRTLLIKKWGAERYQTELQKRRDKIRIDKKNQSPIPLETLQQAFQMFQDCKTAKEIYDTTSLTWGKLKDAFIDRWGEEKWDKETGKRRIKAIEERRQKREPFTITPELGQQILKLFKSYMSITNIKNQLKIHYVPYLSVIQTSDMIRDYLKSQLTEAEYNRIQYIITENSRKKFNTAPTESDKARRDYFSIRRQLYDQVVDKYYNQKVSTNDISVEFNLDPFVVVKFLEEVEKDPLMRNIIKKRKVQG